MSIYDELKMLQEIPDAYGEWADYRKELTGYLLENIEPGSGIGIFGAGGCNDMELSALSEHAGHVTLFDRNRNAAVEAVKKLAAGNPGLEEKVTVQEADFFGITDEDYRMFTDLVHHQLLVNGIRTDIEQLCAYAMDLLTPIYRAVNEQELDFGTNSFDYVIAVGVHSQLNNMAAWIWDAFSQALGQQDGNFYTLVMQENEVAVRRFNDALMKAAGSGLILGCETETLGQPGSVQGAVQALADVEERIEKKQLVRESETELLWPFQIKSGICYRMRIQKLQCLQNRGQV